MVTADEALRVMHAADRAHLELLRAVLADAEPVMKAAWEASPGKLENLLGGLMRVDAVCPQTDNNDGYEACWEEIWLARAAYVPFADSNLVLVYVGVSLDAETLRAAGYPLIGRDLYELQPVAADRTLPKHACSRFDRVPEHARQGVVWLRERGTPGRRLVAGAYKQVHYPWVTTIRQGPAAQPYRSPPVEQLKPAGQLQDLNGGLTVEEIVFEAALRWKAAARQGAA